MPCLRNAAALVPHGDGTLWSWGCAGGPASSRSAASGDSRPRRGLAAVPARRCVCHGRPGDDISYVVDRMDLGRATKVDAHC